MLSLLFEQTTIKCGVINNSDLLEKAGKAHRYLDLLSKVSLHLYSQPVLIKTAILINI